MANKRNGEIDFFRFVFVVIIVFFHFNTNYKFDFFVNGYIGVEFFFIVSGFLMVRHVDKNKTGIVNLESVPNETWIFLVNKVKSFYLYYFSAILLQVPIRFLLVKHEGIAELVYRFLSSIPIFNLSFVGLNSYGGSLYVGNTWYLSAMLISMLVLYPLLLWRYNFSTKLLFPLIALFFLGYMNGTDTPVYDWDGWAGLVSIGLLRGFAVIALGASLYPLSAFIIEKYSWLINPGSDQKALKIIVTLVKVSSYVIVIVYAFGSVFGQSFRQDFFYHAVMFCSLGVLLSFSNAGYCIPDSKMTRYLGKISLPVFMYHGFLRWALWEYIGQPISLKLFAFLIIMSIVVSVLLMYLTDFVSIWFKRAAGKK